MKFEVHFTDNSIIHGNSFDGSWKKLPNKPISKVIYYTNFNKKIELSGYKEYNHVFPRKDVFGQGADIIPIVTLLARKETSTDIFIINIPYRKIFRKECLIGNEYKGRLLNFWMDGLYNTPKYDVN